MGQRVASWAMVVVSWGVLVGCAVGEPIGDYESAELAENEVEASGMSLQLFVEVANDRGRPLAADAVWIALNGDERTAVCMDVDKPRCETWLADFETTLPEMLADPEITIVAEVCGGHFFETVSVTAHEPGSRSVLLAHVVVMAERAGCAAGAGPRS